MGGKNVDFFLQAILKLLMNSTFKLLLFLFLITIASGSNVIAQINAADSLSIAIKKAKNDTVKVNLCHELSEMLRKSLPDSALHYAQCGLKLATQLKFKKGMANHYATIAIIYRAQGIYDKALENIFKSLKLREELKDSNGLSSCYNNIGLILADEKSYDKALDYYKRSLRLKEQLNDKIGAAKCYNNIGIVFSNQRQYQQAVDYYLKALKLFQEINFKTGIIACYSNLGFEYSKLGQFDKAIEYNQKSLKIRLEQDDKNGIAISYSNIASLNVTLADSTAKTQKEKVKYYQEAIRMGLKALHLSTELKALMLENQISQILYKAYRGVGDLPKALEYSEKYIITKDSIFQEEKTKALIEMEAVYQSDKKQKEIELLEKNKDLQNEEIAKQRLLRNSFIAGFIFILVIAFIILRSYNQKKKANLLLSSKNNEIEQQKNEIQISHEIITEKNNLIIESIEYAKSIQEAILTSEEYLSKTFREHFVLFIPKDIVSGDFFWVYKSKNNKVFCVTADCTGHGVSGGFMTMIGNSLLNEIIIEDAVEEPNLILDKLRDSVIKTLNKDSGDSVLSKVRNGMDLSLCVIDLNTNKLLFSGANNGAYIIRNGQVIELRGDKQPIGIHKKMIPFTLQELELQSDDLIYTFTDGYPDQLGGPEDMRFKISALKEIILSVCNLNMSSQKQKLLEESIKWRRSNDQTDDITVFAFRI